MAKLGTCLHDARFTARDPILVISPPHTPFQQKSRAFWQWPASFPRHPNIIPGRAEFSVELRDLDAAKVRRIWGDIEKRFAQISKEENVPIECKAPDFDQPANANPLVQQTIRDAARSAGLAYLDMPSGAGHDPQNAARFAPMGMIFVPSRSGISHSPLEFTPWNDVTNGAEVLYRTILLLDQRLGR